MVKIAVAMAIQDAYLDQVAVMITIQQQWHTVTVHI
jgi:hypothetical protein